MNPASQPAAALTLVPAEEVGRSYAHPDDVMGDLELSPLEKRAILASWASDVRAVENAPALRQLDSGAIVGIDDILRALKSLDPAPSPVAALQPKLPQRLPLARRRGPSFRRLLRQIERATRDHHDDDDPPPCPASAAVPIAPRRIKAGAREETAVKCRLGAPNP